MAAFFVRKFIQYGLVLFVALSLNFFLPRMMPGDPLVLLAGEDVGMLTPEARAEILERAGLDKPLWQQYVSYLGKTLRGDWGYSYQRNQPIGVILQGRIGWTVLLAGSSLLLSTLLGVTLGVTSAWRRGQGADLGILGGALFLQSLPSFWLGMVLIAVFAAQLGWLPTYGATTAWVQLEGWDRVADVLSHLVLPVITLSLISIPDTFLVTRYSMLDVRREEYITVANAKGLSQATVLMRHAVRNALLPVATIFMLNLGAIIGGATVVETVFSYPGVGRLLYEAVLHRDYPVLQATFLVITVGVIVGNVLADLSYPLLDPRVRRAGRSAGGRS